MTICKVLSRSYSSNSFTNILSFLNKNERRFDGFLKKTRIIECEDGRCLAELKVDKEHSNILNGLHGGAAATLTDTISTIALLTHKKKYFLQSVSVDLYVQYLKPAIIGDEILIEADTVKCGKNMAYLRIIIKNKKNGDILVCGNHVKCFIPTTKSVIDLE